MICWGEHIGAGQSEAHRVSHQMLGRVVICVSETIGTINVGGLRYVISQVGQVIFVVFHGHVRESIIERICMRSTVVYICSVFILIIDVTWGITIPFPICHQYNKILLTLTAL